MQKKIWLLIVFVTLCFSNLMAAEKLTNEEKIELRKIARKNTVKVTTQYGHGSGFVIKQLGNKKIIMTNAHVVMKDGKMVREVIIKPYSTTGKEYNAVTLFALNNQENFQDFAFIVVHDDEDVIGQPVELAEDINIGDYVLAVGAPLDEEFFSDDGKVVEVKNEKVKACKLVIHDALIERGNSGGGLFNSKGELVGINTYLQSDQNGIAVFSDFIKKMQFYSLDLYADKFKKELIAAKKTWKETGIKIDTDEMVLILGEGNWPVNINAEKFFGDVPVLNASGTNQEALFNTAKKKLYPQFNAACILGKIGNDEAFPLVRETVQANPYAFGAYINENKLGQLYFALNLNDYAYFPEVPLQTSKNVISLTVMVFDFSKWGTAKQMKEGLKKKIEEENALEDGPVGSSEDESANNTDKTVQIPATILKNKAISGGAKGNMGALLSALSIYFGDNTGKWPNTLSDLVPKYIVKIPKEPFSGSGKIIVSDADVDDVKAAGPYITNAGGYIYFNKTGRVFYNLKYLDYQGQPIYYYGYQ